MRRLETRAEGVSHLEAKGLLARDRLDELVRGRPATTLATPGQPQAPADAALRFTGEGNPLDLPDFCLRGGNVEIGPGTLLGGAGAVNDMG